MKITYPKDCGNSPRSMHAAEIAAHLRANDVTKLKDYLAESFRWNTPGESEGVDLKRLETMMAQSKNAQIQVSSISIQTAFSHGKYAAVTSESKLSDGSVSYAHDLIVFSSAGAAAKVQHVTSYIVDGERT